MKLQTENTLEKVRILDTTLRDGAQTPNTNMSFYDKFAIAKALAFVGVDVVEIGFAGNEIEIEGMKRIAYIGNREFARSENVPIICCFSKTIGPIEMNSNSDYIKKAFNCVANADPDKRMIHTFVGTSKELIEYRHPKKEKEIIQIIKDNVSYARSLVGELGHVEFSPEDALRADLDFLVEVIQTAISSGANVINITDTTGFSLPDKYYHTVRFLVDKFKMEKNIIFSAHVHNDSGNAVATTLKGILAGVRQVEGTLLQLGERAGNADWITVVTNLHILKSYYNIDVSHIKTNYFLKLSNLTSKLINQPIPLTTPIIGQNAFAESFEIHVEGLLKNQKTYFIVPPELVGQKSSIILGHTTGRKSVLSLLKENGFWTPEKDYNEDQLNKLTSAIQAYCLNNNGITNSEFRLLAEHYLKGRPIKRKITLNEFEIKVLPDSTYVRLSLNIEEQLKEMWRKGQNFIEVMMIVVKDILNIPDDHLSICNYKENYQYFTNEDFEIFNDILLNTEEATVIQKALEKRREFLAESFIEISYGNAKYQGKGIGKTTILSTLNAMINVFDAIYCLNFLEKEYPST